MISITRLREFLVETKYKIDGINFTEMVIDDSQFVSFLKERKENENAMLFGVVPQYPLDGKEDMYKWINQLQFFILIKRSNRDRHDELMQNMEITRALAYEFVEYVITNAVGDDNLFCGLSNELINGSLLVHPVWNKAQCDGWAIEFDLINSFSSSQKLLSNSNNFIPSPPTPPLCEVPVINSIPNNQYKDRIFVTVGLKKTWQIIGTNNPTSYNAIYGDLQGVSVNTETGVVEYTALEEDLNKTLTIRFTATNECGVGSLLRFIQPISTNVTILNTPINQEAFDINPAEDFPIKSFLYKCDILPYEGTLTNCEIWVKGGIYSDWLLVTNFTSNIKDTLQTKIPCGQVADTYIVKSRIKNNLGEYSPYTDELEVNVP